MDEAIYMLSPMDTPLLNGVGTDGNTILSQQSVDEIKFDWMDEEALLPNSNLTALVATAGTVLTLTAGHRLRFSTGDILVIHKAGGTERVQVASYGTTADTLVITRAFSGADTNYASGAKVVGLGTALAEGSDPENARSVDRAEYFNYTQIYGPTKISITRTEQGRAKYGVSDELAHQTYLRMHEAAISREQAFLYGVRTNDTGSKIRTSGGVEYFLSTNVDATSTQLTVAKIESNLLSCYNAGGLPDQLWVNPKSTSDLNAAQDGAVRTVNVDTRRGNVRAQMVTTEYGDMTVLRNRYMYEGHAFGVSREGITRRIFTPTFLEKLAKTGDSENWQFLCEEGLEVKGEQHMFEMNALVY